VSFVAGKEGQNVDVYLHPPPDSLVAGCDQFLHARRLYSHSVGCCDCSCPDQSYPGPKGGLSLFREFVYKGCRFVQGKSACSSWLVVRQETVAKFSHTSIRPRLETMVAIYRSLASFRS
jgi:hypothetical protein